MALVDDKDFDFLNQFKWSYVAMARGYAERRLPRTIKNKPGKLVRMHTFLLNPPNGFMVDHINLNGLDNRRENLRLCTKAQNMMNRDKTIRNQTGFKGVIWDSFCGLYKAQLKKGIKNYNLGRFKTAKEAARAYNEGAIKYHGRFARLNKI